MSCDTNVKSLNFDVTGSDSFLMIISFGDSGNDLVFQSFTLEFFENNSVFTQDFVFSDVDVLMADEFDFIKSEYDSTWDVIFVFSIDLINTSFIFFGLLKN